MQHPVTAPPIPERVRTLAVGAAPTHVSVAGSALPATAVRGGVDAEGRPILLVKPDELLYGVTDEIVVTVDLVATRAIESVDRARGMLKVRGWIQPVPADEIRDAAISIAERCPDEDLFAAVESRGPRLLRVDVAQVVYLTGQESGVLDAEDYLAATPDPFLDAAERMLHHVNSAHRAQLVEAVAVLLGAPAPNAWLWELDRFGATVRTAPDNLIRLPWPAPVTSPTALEQALACLLCRH
ncbi:hypothetical protein Acor_36570 [Acrocarpospora corrugata]|uniref:DUF2470 domain-containing protein n=1 Tax=Acrocarpospora corrugata TaxID=35763 RepID=A0A5M3W2Q6_9ACTN|nr:DUF2470 domain-containing protein [Acrocarpospora corrugata]GES01593.1 hypothetical protein Acor_36570 [Acrocarpospora corrugata]